MKKVAIILSILILLPLGVKVTAQGNNSIDLLVGTGMITADYQKMMTSVGINVDLSTDTTGYGSYSVTYIHTDNYDLSASRAIRAYREFKFMPVDYNMFFGLGVGMWVFVDHGSIYGGGGGSMGIFLCDKIAVSTQMDIILSEEIYFMYSVNFSHGL